MPTLSKKAISQALPHSFLATVVNALHPLGKKCYGTWTLPLKKTQVKPIQRFTPVNFATEKPLGASAQTMNFLNSVMTALNPLRTLSAKTTNHAIALQKKLIKKTMEELILACNELNQALSEKIAAEKLVSQAKQRVDRARSKFDAAQRLPDVKALEHQTPVIYSFEGNFYCIYISDSRFFADKAKVIS